MARKSQIQVRRDTAANWTATNPTLAAGEIGFESDTNKAKIGTGATAWNSLSYFGGGSSSPLTTKGDVWGFTSTDARIPVGSDGQLLVADSSQSLGLKWANSGVTAASYGDSTHVGQFTVNAAGLITTAAAVAISGTSGGANLTVLFDSTLGADTAAIDTGANGIAGGLSHLIIVAQLRTSEAVVVSTGNWTFNNDTGANYDRQTLRARGAAASSGGAVGASNMSLNYPGSSVSASHFGASFGVVPAYTQTTAHKVFLEMGGWADGSATGNSETHVNASNWRNTAAVTRMAVTAGSGNLLAGSRLTIYGSG